MKALFAVVLALSFGMSVAALADDASGMHNEPCKADVQKFCKDVKPGHGAIARCMKEHKDELSSECKERIEKRMEHHQERAKKAREACKGDVEKFCKDVKPGQGRIVKCLKDHESELSDSCKDVRHPHKD